MPLASKLMSSPRVTALRELLGERGLKFIRYCLVSGVNVVVGTGTMLVMLVAFDAHRVIASLTAWFVSTPVAYLLYRQWVWRQSGTNSMKTEIAPFWIMALVGLFFAGIMVWVAGFFTESSIALVLVQLASYGVVWVIKYLILDRLMWGPDRTADIEVEVV